MSPLRAARQEHLLRQSELAELVGVSKQRISAVERGIEAAGWRLRKKLSRTLGIPERVLCPDEFEQPGRITRK